MTLTPYHIDVYNAKICPYCKSTTKVITEVEVYGREYKGRSIISCKNFPKCDSYVGTHEDGSPLGRLADKSLRNDKKQAHLHFDKIWMDKLLSRDVAYEKLADFLELEDQFTHIGMFNSTTCKKVVEWSKKQYSLLKNK